MPLKLGRQPRKFDERIPRMSLIASPPTSPIPLTLDNSAGMPDDLGEMLNSSLGCCTAAAFFHARQLWTFTASGKMLTDPDADVLSLYESTGNYNPADPATDQGAVEQDVLAYLLNTGAQTAEGTDKIAAYVEVDQHNLSDLRRTIYDCGAAYIGIQVPQSVMDHADDNTIPWDVTGDQTILGGHAIILVGFTPDDFTCISWGKRYKVTAAFLNAWLDEAYGIIDRAWVETTGVTPFGMTLLDLESAMQALKYAA